MNSVIKTLLLSTIFGAFAVYQIAGQTELYKFTGTSGEDFGVTVSGAGDVNQDGYEDVIVGAPKADTTNGTDSGYARLFSGKDGTILYTFIGASADDYFGSSVAGAGDVNRDGYPDVIVGASRDDTINGTNSGSAWVFSGEWIAKTSNQQTPTTQKVLLSSPWIGDGPDDFFGGSVNRAGDVNRDGTQDLIVGAPEIGGTTINQGYLRVFSGIDGSELRMISGESTGDGFGHPVSGAGDVNNDGYDDIIIGAPHADNGKGYIYVFSGKDWTRLCKYYIYSSPTGHNFFGASVSGAGDVNKDGYADVIVGSPRDDWASLNSGSVWVFSGEYITNDGNSPTTNKILYSWHGNDTQGLFGEAVSGVGDVNKDGWPDLAVGAIQENNNGALSGSLRVYSGKNGAVIFTKYGNTGDKFGVSVSITGDVDKDGRDDVIAGTHTEGHDFAWVISYPEITYYVRPDGDNENTGKGNTTSSAFQHIQYAIDRAGSGDTILVAPGIYNEQLTIRDKSLTLVGGVEMPGVPAGETVVEMPESRTPDPGMKISDYRVLVSGWNTATQADPTVWIQDTTPATPGMVVNISNITFDGLDQSHTCSGNYFYTAVVYKSCSGPHFGLHRETIYDRPDIFRVRLWNLGGLRREQQPRIPRCSKRDDPKVHFPGQQGLRHTRLCRNRTHPEL